MDYKEELDKIEKDVNEKKIEKVRLEERQKALGIERDDILKELAELGVSLDELDSYLEKEEKEIKEGIEECQKILLEK